jgi:hypothetical protein
LRILDQRRSILVGQERDAKLGRVAFLRQGGDGPQ